MGGVRSPKPAGETGGSTYELLVEVNRPDGQQWWRVQHSGTCHEVTGALDELARRIRHDIKTGAAGAGEAKCTTGGEAYWPDGEPLDIWGGERRIKEIPTELFAHAALIRQTAHTGLRDSKDWAL
ncbi:Uncharacterised protein [Mycobacteroides abscessus subsp. massiliense]|nr:Uncharacterised protein [Mycobacteroides abscessus subsp. massiliense]SKK30901.1 Uncharacterised protein [Mycobacteroides abscessus subsp. massiliense]SKK50183.1 Uncharacterised protein [Mycobacteroides abscessus subsp. massiliense]